MGEALPDCVVLSKDPFGVKNMTGTYTFVERGEGACHPYPRAPNQAAPAFGRAQPAWEGRHRGSLGGRPRGSEEA